MRGPLKLLLPMCAAALVSAAAPTNALAKCVERLGHPVLPGYLFIVDGEVVGEYAMGEEAPYPPSEEILVVEVTCRPADRSAQQAAVIVVTKSGARTFMQSYLRELVEAQRQHHADHGEYASTPEELDFFAARVDLPIQMEVAQDAWSATLALEGSDIICRVASGGADGAGHVVRSGATPRPASRSDLPSCAPIE